jgi:hypothetical protein
MDFIYSISAQRGQKAPEIFYFTYSYENAIIYLYEYIVKDNEGKTINDSYSFHTDFYQLNKFPLDFEFAPTDTWSDVKMTKSSKFRIKFKNWGDLKKEYLPIKLQQTRSEKLETILGE